MPRRERPLELDGSAPVEFAVDLRRLREAAGSPTYRELASRSGYSVTTLADAAGGRKLPSLEVTLAYVRACDGDIADWERRWHSVAAELNAVPVAEPAEYAPEDWNGAPYVGLSAYRAEDADRFFGRERLVDDLVKRISRHRFLAVFGPSGSGKSSVLRAGVLPRLTGAVLLTPGPHPSLEGVPAGAIVVVDQFEEVFTLCEDPAERSAFIAALLDRHVVLGVRADFYAHCAMHPELTEAMQDAQFTVGPMTADELRRAITQPAIKANCVVEGDLVATLVAQTHGQAGILPLLSHALLETWRRRSGNRLTLTGFHAVGGIDGALAKTADTVYDSLTPRQQDRARDLFLRLAVLGEGTEDTKRAISPAELDDDPDTALVLDRVTAARLVVRGTDSIEITHEALIRTWPRFRQWLDSDRDGHRVHRELTHATEVWENLDRDPDALYRGARLAIARDLDRTLTARERAFLDASTRAEEAEQASARRRASRLKYLVAVLAVLLLLSAATTIYAVRARDTITDQRNSAIAQNLAPRAIEEHRDDPALGLQLALVARSLSATTATRDGVLSTLATVVKAHDEAILSMTFHGGLLATAGRDKTIRLWDMRDPRKPSLVATMTHGAAVYWIAFSPDGSRLVSAGDSVKLWDVGSRTLIATAEHPAARAVAFSPDGTRIVSGGTGVRLWDNNLKPVATLDGHTDAVRTVAFSPDGRGLASGSDDHTIRLWRLADLSSTVISGDRLEVFDVDYSPDGRTLAVGSGTKKPVLLYDISDPTRPQEIAVMTGHEDVVGTVKFSPDGRTLATGSDDRSLRLWNVTDPRHPVAIAVLTGPTIAVADVEFSPDGKTLAWAMFDPTIRLLGADLDADLAGACASAGPPISREDWNRFTPDVPYAPPCK
ncbi:hypothetical protein Lesp02_39280 [Lentzea sp. NBRC 105346]|uniref:nSTAND1 domain-containing NTPase n=1 Tax=Lentzea sp. NBRC 105346 TaxID=3032205 RepID=UPI0024A244AF|nr:helix-turn-helix domain-containing protein [Lentzea sp. NBRC 105346]GLZ31740.1 hypothetical protein Lesp02_39280 [Lentzea sp. NBRC 105346]